jgi:hypothetical protein
MSNFTIGAITYILVAGFLVSALLIGGMLVLNLGLMSKRDRDLIGGRTPSDVGILKNTTWPAEPENVNHLPAVEQDENFADVLGESRAPDANAEAARADLSADTAQELRDRERRAGDLPADEYEHKRSA